MPTPSENDVPTPILAMLDGIFSNYGSPEGRLPRLPAFLKSAAADSQRRAT